MGKLVPLTGLRFLLALWVVVFHQASPDGYLGPWLAALPPASYNLLRTGYVAVGVFFVLSGFVLAYNYPLETTWSAEARRRFAVARFARIYPSYFLGLCCIAPFVIRAQWHHTSWMDLEAAALNGTLLQSWLPNMATTWNSPGWSLSAEAFFYLVFPWIGVRLWNSRRLAITVSALAILLPYLVALPTGSATAVRVGQESSWATVISMNPLVRLPGFCVGIVLAKVYRVLRPRWAGRGAWFYLPALGLEGLALMQADKLPLLVVSQGLLGLHACLVLGFALDGGLLARILARRGLVFLGNASYAMYILHFPIGKWLDVVAHHVGRRTGGLPLFTVYIGLVVGLSAWVYQRIEEPAGRWLKRRLSPRVSVAHLPVH